MTAATDPALLSAILAAPADDLCRLVYADWLEEQGEAERAGFIRKQIAGELATVRLAWLVEFEKFLGVQPHQCHRSATRGEAVCRAGGNTLIFRRGFVAEVRTTLATWYGGECASCRGAGRIEGGIGPMGEIEWLTCDVCQGRGRLVGIGPAVAAVQPVERVWLTCRAPLLTNGRYYWQTHAWADYDSSLPSDLHVKLGPTWTFPTEADAQNALTLAAARWARPAGGAEGS